MLESVVEKALVAAVRQFGGWALKWVSPGQDGVPDRIVLMAVPAHHQQIVATYVRFVETKAPGGTPRPIQGAVHKRLRKMGYRVDVPDSREAVRALYS